MASSITLNGVNIYALSNGKTLPQWLSSKKRRALNKDEEFQRRIDLIQDFTFPSASQTITMSSDGKYIIATGTYPPRVRVFDLNELSMKFERYMDSIPVASVCLSNDYSKLAFLQDDRTVEIHAAYGRHFQTRIPKFGRAMKYHSPTSELIIGGDSNEIYRLSLEAGSFVSPFETSGDLGVNAIAISRLTALISAGCDGGVVDFFDPRLENRVSTLQVPRNDNGGLPDISCVEFDESTLTFAVGTTDGRVILYDVRKSIPLITKLHQYELPIHSIHFQRSNNYSNHLVVSSDAKVIKIWDRTNTSSTSSNVFTNIETPVHSNMTMVVTDHSQIGGQDSGMIMATGEQERIMVYYVPALGMSPSWCSFLDNLSEELDGKQGGITSSGGAAATSLQPTSQVFDDYRFITKDELNSLGLSHLLGTPLLKAYMHGYFIDAKLYSRVVSIVNPFAYEKHKQSRIKEIIDESRKSRIQLKKEKSALPEVNQELAAKILEQQLEKEEDELNGAVEGGEKKSKKSTMSSNLLADPRFSKLFSDSRYAIETDSPENRQKKSTKTTSSSTSSQQKETKKRRNNYDSEED
jgi:ribosome biogenesis protein ENP2